MALFGCVVFASHRTGARNVLCGGKRYPLVQIAATANNPSAVA
jgi:hypothetical protein